MIKDKDRFTTGDEVSIKIQDEFIEATIIEYVLNGEFRCGYWDKILKKKRTASTKINEIHVTKPII